MPIHIGKILSISIFITVKMILLNIREIQKKVLIIKYNFISFSKFTNSLAVIMKKYVIWALLMGYLFSSGSAASLICHETEGTHRRLYMNEYRAKFNKPHNYQQYNKAYESTSSENHEAIQAEEEPAMGYYLLLGGLIISLIITAFFAVVLKKYREQVNGLELNYKIIENENKLLSELMEIEKSSLDASIGFITGEFTHEIRQPLNALKIGAEGLKLWTASKSEKYLLPEKMIKVMDGINQAAVQINNTVENLKRKWIGDGIIKLINVNNIINDSMALMAKIIEKNHIKVEFELSSSLLLISTNPAQLKLIIINLVMNSIQALKDKQSGSRDLRIKSYETDNIIFIKISDNGIGLPELNTEKTKKPLFQLDKYNSVVGLGYVVIQRIALSLNAEIDAQANEKEGAIFTIKLLPGRLSQN